MKKEYVEFFNRLDGLISESVCYYYPDKTSDILPDYTQKVKVETSIIKKLIRTFRIKNKFKKYYDLGNLIKSYNMFEDDYSKEMFLKVALYRISGSPILRFPIYYSKHYIHIDKIEDMVMDNTDEIIIWNDRMHLKKYDLSKMGYDVKLWYCPLGISTNFNIEQYRYLDIVKPEINDNVLDCGACYGDTALYFASKTKGGHVYSFEFVSENIDIFNKNVELNQHYKDKIHLYNNAVSDKTGEKISFTSDGPATNFINNSEKSNITTTITIDDFVKQNNIERINFIKMDIEGSEELALKGAINTIRTFKPKLAICAYHKKDDLIVLPQLIKSILPEYKLYIDHYTINRTETVIYAKV